MGLELQGKVSDGAEGLGIVSVHRLVKQGEVMSSLEWV